MKKRSFLDMSMTDFLFLALTLEELNCTLKEYNRTQEYTPEQLAEFGASFGRRFQIKQDPEDIKQAVQLLGRAQSLMEKYTLVWLHTSSNLSAALINSYEQSRDVKYLNRAIDLLTQLAEHLPSDEGDQPVHLLNLWSALQMRYECTQRAKDLDRLVRVGEEIIKHTDQRASLRLLHLQNQQAMLFKRYMLSRRLEDHKMAIDTLYLLVKELPPDDSQRVEHLDWLAKSVIVYYYTARESMPTMQPEERRAALEMLYLIVTALPGDSPDLGECLELLMKMVISSCNQTRDQSAMLEAAQVGETLLDKIPSDAEYLAGIINLIGTSYLLRYSESNDLVHVKQAIQQLESGLARNPPNPFYLRQCHFNLGNAYGMLYQAEHNLEDLNRSVAELELALELSEPDASARPAYVATLAGTLRTRFERTEDLADLQRSRELRTQLKL